MTDEIMLLVPQSKSGFVYAIDTDLIWITMRHLATVCEISGIAEISIAVGPGMLNAVFHPNDREHPPEQLNAFVREVGA